MESNSHTFYSKGTLFESRTYDRDSLFLVILYFCTTHCSLRLIVQSELNFPTFATRRLHTCHHPLAPSGGRWNCGREMSWNFA
jgi:hypothetical protein